MPEYELHPTGWHEVEVQEHRWEKSRRGDPMLVVVVASDHGQLWHRMVFNDKTIEYRIEDLRRMGFSGSRFRDCDDGVLVGHRFRVLVIHEDYTDAEGNRKTSAKIKSIFGERVRRERSSEALDLASRWDGLLAAEAEGGDQCPF